MNGRSLIILTMPAKVVSHFFSSLELHGGGLFLASVDGKVIIPRTLHDTQIVIDNNAALVQSLKLNGDVKAQAAFIILLMKATKREMPLGASLIKQKNATLQAERKKDVKPNSHLAENLVQMDKVHQRSPRLKNQLGDKKDVGWDLELFNLARLMGGEIEIVSKAGERGTYFRVTIFLRTCQPPSADADEECPRTHAEIPSSFGRTMWPPSQGSEVILIISGNEQRHTLKRYIGSLNIRVTARKPENFLQNIETIMYKLDNLNNSASTNSDAGVTEGPLNTRDGSDVGLPSLKISNSKGSAGLVLLVVDVSAGLFSELYTAVASMTKGLQNSRYKVVWLDNPLVHNSHLVAGEANNEASDYVVDQPLHGSHLMDVLKLLPEIGQCTSPSKLPKLQSMAVAHGVVRTEEADTSLGKGLQSVTDTPKADTLHGNNALVQKGLHKSDSTICEKPLNGKRVLVVDDGACPRKLTVNNLHKLGATVEVCKDGKEALDKVVRILRAQTEEGRCRSLPYDFILMDCKMPIMDGYEATQMIRMEEQKHGVHVQIIVLTSNLISQGWTLTWPSRCGGKKLMDLLQSVDIIK
ncbi:hypothetical protein NL676_020068 [Syzygium grande]|nr:hypothetical protein NL676_020068 [Syzygium grande]